MIGNGYTASQVLLIARRLARTPQATRAPARQFRRLATHNTPTKRGAKQKPQAARSSAPAPPAKSPSASASPQAPAKPPGQSQAAHPEADHVATKYEYPESLLIYHTGQGRTIFIATVKYAGVFLWIAGTFLVAPVYYFDPLEESWMAPVVALGSAIPLAITVFLAPPFVTYIHLMLPAMARSSPDKLRRFASRLPSSAKIDITSVKWIWPKVTRLNASELYIAQNSIGSMTLRREIPAHVLEARRWFQRKPLDRFLMAGYSKGPVREKGIWEEVLGCIIRGWQVQKAAASRRGSQKGEWESEMTQ